MRHVPMRNRKWPVAAVDFPAESRIGGYYESANFADAYSIGLPVDAITDPERLARFLFAQQPSWVGGLMKVRDGLVAGFGLKTSRQLKTSDAGTESARVHILRIYESNPNEIILGEDDKHLDFQAVGFLPAQDGCCRERTTHDTVHGAKCHNRLGRAYIMLIAPFHRLVVRSDLRRAARTGWPTQGMT